MEAEMAANLEPLWLAGKEKLSERLRALMERGRETRAVDYQRTLRSLPAVAESFDELFMERYDAILTPPALGTAPKGLGATGDPAFCVLWTLLGMPAVTLPRLPGANGLPLRAPLVGRRDFHPRALRTAARPQKQGSPAAACHDAVGGETRQRRRRLAARRFSGARQLFLPRFTAPNKCLQATTACRGLAGADIE